MLNDNEDVDKIEEMKKRLYQIGSGSSKRRRTKLSPTFNEIKSSWEKAPVTKKVKKYSRPSFLIKLLVASVIFFLGTLLVAGFILMEGSNVVSNRNIDLVMRGPATVRGGDETTFQISVANRNNVPLEQVRLTINYPNDAEPVADENLVGSRTVIDIGSIRSGQIINRSARVVLFGRENDEREVFATLEYRIPGSNAFFEKKTSIKFIISSSPISVNVRTLSEVVDGDEAILEISVVSNADTTLSNILLNASYPLGFNLSTTSPEPDFGNNVWSLGDFSPGQEKRVTIRGVLSGQDRELKSFNFSIGPGDLIGNGQIVDVYSERLELINISSPFVNTFLVVNGRSLPSSTFKAGQVVRVDVGWQNNLPTPVVDAQILLTLDGQIINPSQVNAGAGFYSSGDRTIVWNRARYAPLTEILPGQRGQTSFTFSTYNLATDAGASILNPEVRLGVILQATRISPGFVGEIIQSETSHTIRFDSDLKLSAKALHSSGPFSNSGPMPPQSEVETTYTIVWTLDNSSNELSNLQVRTVLPPSVRFLNNFTPNNESLSFDESTGEVVWRVANLSPAAGPASGTREISFQVGLTPSANQIGGVAELTGQISFSSEDNFTGNTLSGNLSRLDTRLSSDPSFENRQAIIVN